MGNIQFYNNKMLFANNKVAMASDCCCFECECETKTGDISSCFATDKTPDTYAVVISGVTECSDGGCEDCAWVNGSWCLDHTSADEWEYTSGNYTITLELTGTGTATTLVAENNGDVCFSGSSQVDGGDCVLGGMIFNDLESGDCDGTDCGYDGSALFYHECGRSGCTCCDGTGSSCDTPMFAVATFEDITVESGGTWNPDGCSMSVIQDATSFNGTWVLPFWACLPTYKECDYVLEIEDAGGGYPSPCKAEISFAMSNAHGTSSSDRRGILRAGIDNGCAHSFSGGVFGQYTNEFAADTSCTPCKSSSVYEFTRNQSAAPYYPFCSTGNPDYNYYKWYGDGGTAEVYLV